MSSLDTTMAVEERTLDHSAAENASVQAEKAQFTPNKRRGMAYLAGAIAFELLGTTCLKLSEGFTVLAPSIVFVIGYTICTVFMVMALRDLPLGFMYGIWGGVGTVLTAFIGVVIWHDVITVLVGFGFILVIAGIYLLNRGSDELGEGV